MQLSADPPRCAPGQTALEVAVMVGNQVNLTCHVLARPSSHITFNWAVSVTVTEFVQQVSGGCSVCIYNVYFV